MELKINIDTKALAAQLLKDMCQNLHGNVVKFTQQKFIPSSWNPIPFPIQGPGMGMGGTPYPNQQGFAPFGYNPNIGQQSQTPIQPTFYYSPEKFKNYAEAVDKLAVDEELIKKLENIVSIHITEFLNLDEPNSVVKKKTTANS